MSRKSKIAETTAQIHAAHLEQTSPLQIVVDRLTAFVGQPGSVAGLAVVILAWIGFNLFAERLDLRPFDPPPFTCLQGLISIAALFVAVLILTTQRHENQLAGHREQLILELMVLNEQKVSKAIELIEEVRRDSPAVKDRVDTEAAAMSTPSDTRAVMDAIKEVQATTP